jgi:predicted nucleotide-binding protein
VFIGSSTEALEAANTINTSLSKKTVTTRCWSQGVFQASKTTIEDLWSLTRDADFAIIVLSPDDVSISRGNKKQSPRDNVIFELGLFIGALGRERAFIVAPGDIDIKIPTDLLGVTFLPYKTSGVNTLGRRLQPICKELSRLITELGPR